MEEIKRLSSEKNQRDYEAVHPLGGHPDSWKEAQVVYDRNKFVKEELSTNELDQAIQKLDRSESERKVDLRERKDGKPRAAGIGQVVKERTSLVCLRRNDGPHINRSIIFVSFHNYNTKDSDKGAKLFCKAVAVLGDQTGFDVVAGADFNCNIEKLLIAELGEGIRIADYTMTTRRENRKGRGHEKIDFIVTKTELQTDVKAQDFMARRGIAKQLHEKEVKNTKGQICNFTSEDYDKSVDHDPLVCTLTLTTPPSRQAQEKGCCIIS